MMSGAVMPGWRFTRGSLTVSVFAGPVVQDYRLSPYDPGSRLHGLYAGAQAATEIWYQPTTNTMAAVSGSVASIGPTGSLRAPSASAPSMRCLSARKPKRSGATISSNMNSART